MLKSLKNSGIKDTYIKIKYNIFDSNGLIKNRNISLINMAPKRKIVDNSEEIKNEIDKNFFQTPKEQPLVSILIISRNGLEHLKRLFKAIHENTHYKNFEIIVVDNASKDKSIDFLEANKYQFKLQLIKNRKNESFSYANNQAVELAKGPYLLLLNNDIEPLKGWLSHLVLTMQTGKDAGAVAPQLIFPYNKNDIHSTKVQHRGINFKHENVKEGDFFKPYNMGVGEEPVIKNTQLNISPRVCLSAACMLVKKTTYLDVAGLDEEYVYGYEDVDFSLKLQVKGFTNYYCQNAILFHHESSTQKLDSISVVNDRREKNAALLHLKWYNYIKKHYYIEKIAGSTPLFSEKNLTVAIAVTDAGKNIPEGDFFTAEELAFELKKFGWKVIYLRRKANEWYKIPTDVDVIISLLDAYDPSKIPKNDKKVITIAWARNWFDRWAKQKAFNQYDLVFASSKIACDYIDEHSNQTAHLLPIATNPHKFDTNNRQPISKYTCDYCFTGSYWGQEREIITFIDPSRLPNSTFHIYGKNWNKVEKLKQFDCGFLSYDQMPLVYANAKIVIDDANHVTKPYGSVNSRVFDALASGTLVLTNGVLGSQLTFNSQLPHFSTQDELYAHLSFYLSNEEARVQKVNELREFILSNHTYQHRALRVKEFLSELYQKTSIAIKIPAPNWKVVQEWGDYHFALALKKEFEALGYHVLLQVLSEWDNNEGNACDIALVLRGLSRYTPKPHQVNLMWNISHPDKITIEEYNDYDHIFISSILWADTISKKASVPVTSLLQCSDTDLFKSFHSNNADYTQELLFVGNSRKVYRKVIQDVLPTKYKLSIYGTNWSNLVDSTMIKGEHITNKELHKYYASADIVLNDHWDDMREKGFISNRIFDVLASGGFIISDAIDGIESVFEDVVITYKDKDDLKEKIDYYMQHPLEREAKVRKGLDLITQHTFKSRAKVLSKAMLTLLEERVNL